MAAAPLGNPVFEGRLVRVCGLVQGVGFRPTVWRIATAMGLTGHVRNDAAGVEIALCCSDADYSAFRARLVAECPPLARIDSIETASFGGQLPEGGFGIAASLGGAVKTGIVADAAFHRGRVAAIISTSGSWIADSANAPSWLAIGHFARSSAC